MKTCDTAEQSTENLENHFYTELLVKPTANQQTGNH